MPRQARIDAPGALHHIINRYKSILCEEDRYLKQLVAYIHLNPLRAGIEKDVKAIGEYPFTGHSALMGKANRPWQDTRYVLAVFGKSLSEARQNLQRHVAKWALKGRSPELTGGGLVRSSGGWREVKEAYRDGIRLSSDERILGSSDFVEKTLKEASEDFDRRLRLPSAGIDLSSLIDAVCRYLAIDQKERLVDMTRKPKKEDALAELLAAASAAILTDLILQLAMDRPDVRRECFDFLNSHVP